MKLSSPSQVIAAIICSLSVLLLAAWLLFLWIGTTVVFDPHDQVQSVEFRYHDQTETMTKLPWGTWIGRADGDGSMIIICKDGTEAEGGYITQNFGFYVTVEEDCELSVEF